MDKEIEGIKVNKSGKLYVSNPYLLQEILISKEKGQLTDNAIKMFLLMIENISAKKHYNDNEDKKDCWQSAWEDVLKYWKGFDETKSEHPNPFAYFTSVIVNGMNKGWHKVCGKIKTSDIISLDNNVHSL